MLRKKVRILGRSVSISTLLAAVLVVGALAWGVYLILTAYQVINIDVKAAPVAPLVEFPVHQCNLAGGSTGSVVSNWDLPTMTLTCDYSDFDELTDGRMNLNVLSLETVQDIGVTITLPPSTACVEFYEHLNGGAVIGPSSAKAYTMGARGIAGPSGTITCAGTSIGPFSVTMDLELLP